MFSSVRHSLEFKAKCSEDELFYRSDVRWFSDSAVADFVGQFTRED